MTSYPLCASALWCPETAEDPEGPADEWFLSSSQQLPSSPETCSREREGVCGQSKSWVPPIGECEAGGGGSFHFSSRNIKRQTKIIHVIISYLAEKHPGQRWTVEWRACYQCATLHRGRVLPRRSSHASCIRHGGGVSIGIKRPLSSANGRALAKCDDSDPFQ